MARQWMHLRKRGGHRRGWKRQGHNRGMCLVRVWGLSGRRLLYACPDREGSVLAVAEAKREVGTNCE